MPGFGCRLCKDPPEPGPINVRSVFTHGFEPFSGYVRAEKRSTRSTAGTEIEFGLESGLTPPISWNLRRPIRSSLTISTKFDLLIAGVESDDFWAAKFPFTGTSMDASIIFRGPHEM